ncbi:MAG TPA: HAD family acid phosphatase [Chiayiivirga sp.]|nr:HAD family acid phosphatase [Chiayiivirga sp.]
MRVMGSVSLLAVAVLLGACATAPRPVVSPSAATEAVPAHDNLNATVWMQSSAEYEASIRGIYAAAERSLDAALADSSWSALPQGESQAGFESKPPAIIVDADETMIDNSAYQARSIRENRGYTAESWQAWVNARAARAMPGAVDFANYAKARDVTIFFITNRDAPAEYAATVANLRALGFPIADDASNVVLRGDARAPDREKGDRRRWVGRNYRVVLMLGDNLADFLDGTSADVATRQTLMAPYREWWGQRWFMLPNPTYGSWENAVLRSCERDTSPRACLRASLRDEY